MAQIDDDQNIYTDVYDTRLDYDVQTLVNAIASSVL